MAETKDNIIITAQKLFARFGLNKTSVDEIAKITHVAKGTIYHYFKSKEEIFEEVINKEELFLKYEIRKSMAVVNSPQEKLRIYVLTRFKFLKSMENYYSALKDDYLKHYTFIEKIRRQNHLYELEIISSILKQGCDDEIFSIENIDFTALAILISLKGLEHYWVIESTIEEIEGKLTVLLRVLFKGIEIR